MRIFQELLFLSKTAFVGKFYIARVTVTLIFWKIQSSRVLFIYRVCKKMNYLPDVIQRKNVRVILAHCMYKACSALRHQNFILMTCYMLRMSMGKKIEVQRIKQILRNLFLTCLMLKMQMIQCKYIFVLPKVHFLY